MNAPRLLVLETSGRIGQVGLAVGAQLLATRRLDEARRHARDLAPVTAELLTLQGWKARDLDGVVVNRGPGSYTGLRVGIMAAKTLAYATRCALIGVDAFAALAQQVSTTAARLEVLADAQQDKVYAQSFVRTEQGWSPASALTILPFAAWLQRLTPDVWVTGPGLYRWEKQISRAERIADPTCWDTQPMALLHLGLSRWAAGVRDDPWALEPLYLRPSAAEEQWSARGR